MRRTNIPVSRSTTWYSQGLSRFLQFPHETKAYQQLSESEWSKGVYSEFDSSYLIIDEVSIAGSYALKVIQDKLRKVEQK